MQGMFYSNIYGLLWHNGNEAFHVLVEPYLFKNE